MGGNYPRGAIVLGGAIVWGAIVLLLFIKELVTSRHYNVILENSDNMSQGVGGHPGPPLYNWKKILFFLRKIVIFHTKYPNKNRAFLRNWKKYDFLA